MRQSLPPAVERSDRTIIYLQQFGRNNYSNKLDSSSFVNSTDIENSDHLTANNIYDENVLDESTVTLKIQMGVISIGEVPKNLRFGPIPTTLMIADPAFLVGNMTSDILPEIPEIRVSILHSLDRNKLEEWVPYLRSARNPNEQNLELYREDDGDLFYETSRLIKPGEEIFIWFSRKYCSQIGVPLEDLEFDKNNSLNNKSLSCFRCAMLFENNYVLICHRLFKCISNKNTIRIDSQIPSHVTQAVQAKINRKRKISPPSSDTLRELSQTLSNCRARPDTFAYLPDISEQLMLSSTRINNFLNGSSNAIPCFDFDFSLSLFEKQLSTLTADSINETDMFLKPDDNPIKTLLNNSQQPFHGNKIKNPMVENLLKSALSPEPFNSVIENSFPSRLCNGVPLNVAQNWCAKCSTTFRMTSDLVYHMRTHHKSDVNHFTDRKRNSEKSKRNDKLCCSICGESFRERHHLTRHMISHD